MKELIKIINDTLPIFRVFLVSSGVLVVSSYFMAIGFVPRDLSFGDSMVIIIIVISFSWILSIWLIFGVASSFWLVFFIRYLKRKFYNSGGKTKNSGIDDVVIVLGSLMCFALFSYMMVDLYGKGGFERNFNFLASSFPGGFAFLVLIFSVEDNENLQNPISINRRMQVICMAFIFPVMIAIFVGEPSLMIEQSMKRIGIRNENTSIRMSSGNYEIMKEIAERYHVPVFDCGSAQGGYLVHNVDILWHGIGQRSYIRIAKNKNIKFDVNSDGVIPVVSDKKMPPCFEVKGDSLFDKKNYSFRKGADYILEKIKEEISMIDNVEVVEIVGYSDPMRYDNNQELSLKRALEVEKWIRGNVKSLDAAKFLVRGGGSDKVIVKCLRSISNDNIDTDEESRCNAPNRRVEILLKVRGG